MRKQVEQLKLPERMPIGLGVVLVEIRDGKALLEIELEGNLGPSTSEKTILVAKANVRLPGTGLKLNLNLYRRNPDYAEPKKRGSAPSEGNSTSGDEETV